MVAVQPEHDVGPCRRAALLDEVQGAGAGVRLLSCRSRPGGTEDRARRRTRSGRCNATASASCSICQFVAVRRDGHQPSLGLRPPLARQSVGCLRRIHRVTLVFRHGPKDNIACWLSGLHTQLSSDWLDTVVCQSVSFMCFGVFAHRCVADDAAPPGLDQQVLAEGVRSSCRSWDGLKRVEAAAGVKHDG